MSTNQYDDSDKGGYSYEEKLKLVSEGNMDPKEIGLASADDAHLKLVEDLSPEEKLKMAKLGTDLIFEAGEVPPQLRAMWAMQDLKIAVPKSEQPAWCESWAQEHKDEHLIQARIRCGYVQAAMELLCKDTVLGICELLEKGAKAIRFKYDEQLKLEKEISSATDSKEQSGSDATLRQDVLSS